MQQYYTLLKNSYEKVRRIPAKNVDEINKQVGQMINNSIIRPSESQYNSNVILVEKKDKSKRFVIDFRKDTY